MGNVMAIDIGIVLASITIFDKKNKLFPKKLKETGKAKSILQDSSYFEVDQSFYSIEHGGTFHFAHFNIHHFEDFLKSNAFNAIIEFVEENNEINEKPKLLTKLEELKMVFEDPIDGRRRSNSTPVRLNKQKKDLKEKEEEKTTSDTPKVGGGFPSDKVLKKIMDEYKMIKDFGGLQLLCTGGYNNNFLELMSYLLNVKIYKVHKYQESLISAIDYQNTHSNDCFYSLPYKDIKNIYELGKVKSDPNEQVYFSIKENFYPYLLVNLRSGASFIRVDSKDAYRRCIGTSIGAGTFIGITKLLYNASNPTKSILKGLKGDSRNIDMSVGDIYGKSYGKIGLPAEVIASSFGKIKDYSEEEINALNPEDVSLSLLNMIMFNTLTIANLTAQIEGIKNIVVIGHHIKVLELEQLVEMGFSFLSKGKSKVFFLKHSSYIGSLGVLIDHGGLDTLYE
ncbi:unnamed protein product [Moneuplotes crassus]|uniref:Pantothenate kinase n=1 Tax=Euplotes crassus TaxID=5936 RepID=A0AAD1UIG3_EUPCR|nr:unnamed protein product [Moneuplotes crassus]